jgi:hypothetical protein
MAKTVKFTISMSASEFKALEVARRKAGKTRSQFVRESILKANDGRNVRPEPGSVREDPGNCGSPGIADVTDMAELRQRAIDAAGKFASGISDLSVKHDRYLADPEPREDHPGREADRRGRGAR